MKPRVLFAVIVVALSAPVPEAFADKPVREFAPFGSDVIAGFCSFDVLLDPTQANLFVMTFTDKGGQVVKLIASGAVKVRLTNATNGRSITVNISGPEQVRFDASGNVTDAAVGPWLIGFPAEGRLLLTKGRLVFGQGSASLRGTSKDVCTLLAEPRRSRELSSQTGWEDAAALPAGLRGYGPRAPLRLAHPPQAGAAAAAGPDPHVRLRADRLPADPRRQRAAVRRLPLAEALAGATGLRRHARRERHRRQRQDLRRPRRSKGSGAPSWPRAATRWYFEDTDALGLGRPDHEPLASETIPEIVALIEELVGRGLAYESQGDVYFRVASYPDYGELSGAKLEDMVAQEPSDLKEDQRDFALWKATKPHEDTSWPSPWGLGRPGWHIECSAMAEKLLGPVFEIHGGGIDLRFPHHENELAQSRGAGREFARLWAHNGMLELAQEKMSKSLGNIVSLREALDTYGREAILVLFLGAHYRSPVEYSDEAMEAAARQAEDFRTAFRVVERTGGAPAWDEFAAALDDDFNTPLALSILHAWRSAGELGLLSAASGSSASPSRRQATPRPRSSASPRQRSAPAKRGTSTARRRAAARRSSASAGRSRTHRTASGSCPGRDARARLRPAAGARGRARRQARQILELLATERALAAEAWLREVSGLRLQVAPERRLNEPRARPTTRGSSPSASRTAMRTRTSSRPGSARWSSASTR